jgi:MFS transporter, PHS family, inorganic phosphate transporter
LPFHGSLIYLSQDGVELVIIVAATFMQALAGSSPAVGIIGALIMWRFLVCNEYSIHPSNFPIYQRAFLKLGLGIGGDYPLSAVISSEFATTNTRGRMMTAVFSAQGWGQSGMFMQFHGATIGMI